MTTNGTGSGRGAFWDAMQQKIAVDLARSVPHAAGAASAVRGAAAAMPQVTRAASVAQQMQRGWPGQVPVPPRQPGQQTHHVRPAAIAEPSEEERQAAEWRMIQARAQFYARLRAANAGETHQAGGGVGAAGESPTAPDEPTVGGLTIRDLMHERHRVGREAARNIARYRRELGALNRAAKEDDSVDAVARRGIRRGQLEQLMDEERERARSLREAYREAVRGAETPEEREAKRADLDRQIHEAMRAFAEAGMRSGTPEDRTLRELYSERIRGRKNAAAADSLDRDVELARLEDVGSRLEAAERRVFAQRHGLRADDERLDDLLGRAREMGQGPSDEEIVAAMAAETRREMGGEARSDFLSRPAQLDPALRARVDAEAARVDVARSDAVRQQALRDATLRDEALRALSPGADPASAASAAREIARVRAETEELAALRPDVEGVVQSLPGIMAKVASRDGSDRDPQAVRVLETALGRLEALPPPEREVAARRAAAVIAEKAPALLITDVEMPSWFDAVLDGFLLGLRGGPHAAPQVVAARMEEARRREAAVRRAQDFAGGGE